MMPVLSELARRSRQAKSDRELGFLLVNDTLELAPYRQAALCLAQRGVWSLSGVVQVDANVPYVQWLNAVVRHLNALSDAPAQLFSAPDLPPDLAAQWAQWWPEHGLCLRSPAEGVGGVAVFVSDNVWSPAELDALQEWSEVWWHAFAALHRPRMAGWLARSAKAVSWQSALPWWRQGRLLLLGLLLALMFWPVRMTVLASGELVPANPLVIRSPLDGVIDVFHVQPNQPIAAKQALFSFDEIVIQSRLDVARQSLATAETDYRQTSQMALVDAKSRAQLGVLMGKVEERRAEIVYLREQLTRARVLSPQAGVVLMDDPTEWIGKPVATGERILRIATLDDVEVEAWVPMADAIRLETGGEVLLHLSASPLAPVRAKLRYMAHEAVQRPDGAYAYRVRAALAEPTEHRVGLKGTAKLQGAEVALGYWVMRRPWATMRAYLGW